MTFDYRKKNYKWRKNADLNRLNNRPSLQDFLKSKRLEWAEYIYNILYGHMVRRPQRGGEVNETSIY